MNLKNILKPAKKLELIAAAILMLLTSCGKQENKEASVTASGNKVGLVFDIGGRGDKSFNDAAYKGLEDAKQKLGVDFEVIDPGDGSDRESALRKLASKKEIGLVFGVGFIFTDDINKVAGEFPAKKFACIDYSVNPSSAIPDNVAAVEFKEEEGSFLIGALSALTSKSGKIGFIGGMESPLIRKFESGYIQGAKHANSDVQVLSGYVSVSPDGFKNPGKAKEIALSQYSGGADVIYHASGLSGLGLFEAAREKGLLAVGVDMDQYKEAPGYVLSSMVKLVDVAVFETIKSFKENKFNNGVTTFGLSDNGVGFVYDENNKELIPPATKQKLDSIRSEILQGKIKVSTE